jgi:hypothetical protein
MDHAVREFSSLEVVAHSAGHARPENIAAFFVNGTVPDDGKLPRCRGNEDQDAVSVR